MQLHFYEMVPSTLSMGPLGIINNWDVISGLTTLHNVIKSAYPELDENTVLITRGNRNLIVNLNKVRIKCFLTKLNFFSRL